MSEKECCCRELTRVWQALGISEFNGQSASENVTALRQRIAALEAELAERTRERDEARTQNGKLLTALANREQAERRIAETLAWLKRELADAQTLSRADSGLPASAQQYYFSASLIHQNVLARLRGPAEGA